MPFYLRPGRRLQAVATGICTSSSRAEEGDRHEVKYEEGEGGYEQCTLYALLYRRKNYGWGNGELDNIEEEQQHNDDQWHAK
jgi:hypothetical protein